MSLDLHIAYSRVRDRIGQDAWVALPDQDRMDLIEAELSAMEAREATPMRADEALTDQYVR
jgi:hypothetical protein